VERWVLYARISRVTEADDTEGVSRQLADGRAAVTRRGGSVVAELVDNDISASRFSTRARSNYRRLLDMIEAGEVDGVWIWMEDRLHRQVIELAAFLKACEQAGVTRIASAGGEFDLADPDQRMLLYIKAAMAEAEVEKSSKRIRRQRLEAAERGERHAGGSRKFGTVGAGRNTVSAAQAQREQELIREAARRFLAGDSLRGIVLDWYDRGIRTPTGKTFQNSTVRQMLLSPRLAGFRVHHGRLYPSAQNQALLGAAGHAWRDHEPDDWPTLISDEWESIVPVERWQAMRQVLTDPARKAHLRGGAPRYLLVGLVHCGLCEQRMFGMTRRNYGKEQPAAYVCKPYRELRNCGGMRRAMVKVDELICEALFVAVESPEWDRLAERPAADPTRELYEALARDRGLLDRLEDKVAQELIRPEAAKRNRAEIERRMETTRAKLAHRGDSRVAAQVPRNLRSVWPDLSLDRKRAILAAVIERVEIHPQGSGHRFDPDAIKVTWKA
jgi:DNA invertase Pin-like site-specific DNA recombinase